MRDPRIEDFIGIFPEAIPESLCDTYINFYEEFDRQNLTVTRQDISRNQPEVTPYIDKDNAMFFTDDADPAESVARRVKDTVFETFVPIVDTCLTLYKEKYGVIGSTGTLGMYRDVKVQKTKPTQGYHVWHCEQGCRDSSSRFLLAIGYLNTVEEGGETEFLYQSLRVKPEKGTLILLPGAFTHTHRGNPPLSGDKYIINGWVEFTS